MTDALLVSYRDRLDEVLRKSVAASLDAIESGRPKKVTSSPDIEKVIFEVVSQEIQASVVPLAGKLMSIAERAMEERDKAHLVELDRLRQKIVQLEAKLAHLETNQAPPSDSMQDCISAGRWMDAFRKAVRLGAMSWDSLVRHIHNPEEFFSTHPIEDDKLAIDVCIAISKDLLTEPANPLAGVKVEIINELILNLTGPAPEEFAVLTQLMGQLGTQAQMLPAVLTRLAEVFTIVVATQRVVSTFATPTPRYSMYIKCHVDTVDAST